MKKKILIRILICLMGFMLIAGCGSSKSDGADIKGKPESINEDVNGKGSGGEEGIKNEAAIEEAEEDVKDEEKPGVNNKKRKKKADEKTSGRKSLAQRMAGKYSYHYSDENGNDEFFIMDVVPFGGNLYAFCGQAIPEDYESPEAYTFRAAEFIPYDADEMTDTDGDTVTVNELCFSVMANAGMYSDAGHKGTITLTDDGLVFSGFKNEGFLVPEYDDSRLFLKDERVEDAFAYLKREPDGGDGELQGYWILDDKDADLYLEFKGSDLYIYKKDPNTEVYYAAGGCEFSNGSFKCTASRLGYGGEPVELSCDYKVTDDYLTLKINSTDFPDEIPENAGYLRISDSDVHVVTMDEVELDSEALGMYGISRDIGELTSQDYYGVFVSSSTAPEKLDPVMGKLEKAGFLESCTVYTPDFSGLNPEPYYVAVTGMYTSASDAGKVLFKVKDAGFKDAYVKYAGTYTGDKFLYTMHGGETVDVLKDGVMLRGVSLIIPYRTEGGEVTADLFVSKDAVFDKTADTASFGNYEKGDTPYEWIVRNYKLMNEDTDRYLMNGPALSGVFEVGIEDNKITTYYGSYWWD